RSTRPSPPCREPDPTASDGDAELERLLGSDRLEALIERARSPQGAAIRSALRAITGEIGGADRDRLDQELRAAQRIQRALVGLAGPPKPSSGPTGSSPASAGRACS